MSNHIQLVLNEVAYAKLAKLSQERRLRSVTALIRTLIAREVGEESADSERRLSDFKEAVLKALKEEPRTSAQICAHFQRWSTYTHQVIAQLVSDGYIRSTRTQIRPDVSYGRPARVFEITAKGLNYLEGVS